MDPLTFGLVLTGEKAHLQRLAAGNPCNIPVAMWEHLAAEIGADDNLVPCSPALLSTRWHKGYAAITLHDGAIISYVALAPIVRAAGDAHSWAMLAAGLDMEGLLLPAGDIYALTNSWTAPAWRGRGLSLPLRPPLIERHLGPGNLGIADMFGLSSPLSHRLGWQMVAWDRVPFISSCVSMDPREFPEQSGDVWHAPPGTRRYQGPHLLIGTAGHALDRYVYFWASDPNLVGKLESQVCALFRGNLRRWRSVLVNAFAGPERLWSLPFEIYDSVAAAGDTVGDAESDREGAA